MKITAGAWREIND